MIHTPPPDDAPPPPAASPSSPSSPAAAPGASGTATPRGKLRRITAILPLAIDAARRLAAGHGGYRAALVHCVRTVRREGIGGFVNRLTRLPHAARYGDWVARHDTFGATERAAALDLLASLPRLPRFSIVVPTYNSDIALLDAMIASIQAQVYPHWELCIADDASPSPEVRRALDAHCERDARIHVIHRDTNGHISEASNSALSLATGEFVVLVDHDDLLPPHALLVVARYVNHHPRARLFYSDEDKLDARGERTTPYFKPDWNPLLFHSQNLFSHLGVFDTALIREAGGFRKGLEGSQDYDLTLRCVEIAGHDSVVHIPHVLYHWRMVPGSTAGGRAAKPYAQTAARRALAEHLQRTGLHAATIEDTHPETGIWRVRYPLPQPAPLVSIIVPTRDGLALLRHCLDGLLRVTRYPAYEVIVVDNGSVEPQTLAYLAQLAQRPNVRVLRDDSPFNFSALNNRAAALARGSYLCLLNNDTEVLDGGWLDELVSVAALPGIGAVGAALRYPDGRLQHGGVLLGLNGVAGHMHHLLHRGELGYMARAVSVQNVSAVTAACLLVRKTIYEEVGGLDESLRVAFNDVDFCLKIREAGYRNAWTPFAELMHHESASRGSDMLPEKRARFAAEAQWMENRWGEALRRDPAYNPNLSLAGDVPPFSFAEPPRLGMLD
ncbi:glycosyltransferase family 2 protein [Burkholderia glumae]|uniref:glycosyltransferase family 2 protein n=1 Tax=Burkholderia glumae TaxID=337 RepID=UPI0014631CD6|nr:glycosyltransferase family 2 protein [Burkholderia glumae]QJP73739.1 glycosyltransferase family 2 protein [Burkholderia glumae]